MGFVHVPQSQDNIKVLHQQREHLVRPPVGLHVGGREQLRETMQGGVVLVPQFGLAQRAPDVGNRGKWFARTQVFPHRIRDGGSAMDSQHLLDQSNPPVVPAVISYERGTIHNGMVIGGVRQHGPLLPTIRAHDRAVFGVYTILMTAIHRVYYRTSIVV